MSHPFQANTHAEDILDVADDADNAQRQQQRKTCGCYKAGILGQPQQEACLNLEGEKGYIGRRGQHIANGDSTTDDTHHKGCHHQHLVATDGRFLMLFDELYGI